MFRAIELRATGLVKSFADRPVLRGIDLTVLGGEIVAIVGSSGCGKTVLLDTLTGLYAPDKGRVEVADHDASGVGVKPLVDLAGLSWERLDAIRMHWSIVFQRNALFSGTVEENISLWLEEHTAMTPAQVRQRVRESLGAVALDVDDVLRKDRDELSGGMAKRVAIARAIAVDPIVLFYDEPTTGLDPVVSGHIHELIWSTHHRAREDGEARTTVIVTHDKELLRRLAPRVVMLDRGSVCYDGGYAAFGTTDCGPAREYLRAMPVLHARGTGGVGDASGSQE